MTATLTGAEAGAAAAAAEAGAAAGAVWAAAGMAISTAIPNERRFTELSFFGGQPSCQRKLQVEGQCGENTKGRPGACPFVRIRHTGCAPQLLLLIHVIHVALAVHIQLALDQVIALRAGNTRQRHVVV